MLQQYFAQNVVEMVKDDDNIIGLAANGSWLNAELDEFSDLDLILVSRRRIAGDTDLMISTAEKFGRLLNGFTGEHVGEPRLLICLYDNPLLHVDIKFLTASELTYRIEDPHILYDPEGLLNKWINAEPALWPFPGFQWIEDRFWIWLHYATTKLGRGEFFEVLEFLSFLRQNVISPLLLIKNNRLPKGVRRVERYLDPEDLEKLALTVSGYQIENLQVALWNMVALYRSLRTELYPASVKLQRDTEEKATAYYQEIITRNN